MSDEREAWQDMATAPKGHHDVVDLWCIGEHDDIAFYCPDFCAVGGSPVDGKHLYQGRVAGVQWRDGAWRPKSKLRLHGLTVTPTHWRRIPAPPAAPVRDVARLRGEPTQFNNAWIRRLARDIDFAIDVTEPRYVLLKRFESVIRAALKEK